VLRYKLPIIYCNAIGSQTEIVFDGGSLALDANGNIIKELQYFEEDFDLVDMESWNEEHSTGEANRLNQKDDLQVFDKEMRVYKVSDPEKIIDYLVAKNNIRQIHQALLLGIKDYFRKMGFNKAIIGSSGGIDSAVTLALACEALGNQHVEAVLMPSPYSTVHSVPLELQKRTSKAGPGGTCLWPLPISLIIYC
jgi:NAD+ synthase (glutamine-hydrolysing)